MISIASETTLISCHSKQGQLSSAVDDDGASCSTGASTVRACNMTGTFVAPPRPPIAISPLRLHPTPKMMNNDSPADRWISAFKGLLAYLHLSAERQSDADAQAEALAVLLQAVAAEEEDVEKLISDWINKRAVGATERRRRIGIDMFEDMLGAYLGLTNDERIQVIHSLNPRFIQFDHQDEDTVSSMTGPNLSPVRGGSRRNGGRGDVGAADLIAVEEAVEKQEGALAGGNIVDEAGPVPAGGEPGLVEDEEAEESEGADLAPPEPQNLGDAAGAEGIVDESSTADASLGVLSATDATAGVDPVTTYLGAKLNAIMNLNNNRDRDRS